MDTITIERREWEQLLTDVMALTRKTEALSQQFSREERQWLDNADVCGTLNISKLTLQSLRTNGRLPYTFIGNKCYYKPSDVLSLLNKPE